MAASRARADEGFVRLSAQVPLHGDPRRVLAALADGARAWEGEAVDGAPHGLRRYVIDLRLRVGGARSGFATFRKAALLDLGPPRADGDGWLVEIGWRAAGAQPLFPVFAGQLAIGQEDLRVDGIYAPPGGIAGRVADRVLLHMAANGTARWLLTELARAAEDQGPA
jgi:hypothetical protein